MKKVLAMEKYEKNGEEKTSYKEIGTIFESKKGNELLKLNHIPNVVYLIKEDLPREEAQKEEAQEQNTQQDEEIPF